MAGSASDTETREIGRLSRQQNVDLHIGARIRERRMVLGLTQQQMAELIGVTYEQAHKYERGINRLSAARLYNIAMVLGVDVGYFFEEMHSGYFVEDMRSGGSALTRQEDPHDRDNDGPNMVWELVRSFLEIRDQNQQKAVCALVQALAGRPESIHEKSNNPDTREITAPVKFAVKLMDVWALHENEAARLLGFEDEKGLSDLASGAATLSTRDMKDRVRHLLHIREALHSLFRDTDAEREWLREPRPELNGQSPLSLLVEGSMENFLVVSQFVQWMVGR
jgi:transcriptional regulator with XRE-family HTH domain